MLTDVQRHVASCPTCQIMKSSRKRPARQLQLIPPPERAWQQVTMDFVTGLLAGEGAFAWGKGLGFESRCMHMWAVAAVLSPGPPSVEGCQRVRLGGYGGTLTRYLTSPSIPMARSPGGLWAHSDPLLNKPFYPNGVVVGILTLCGP
ncbi:unnamed protein product [Closterium sp. NIES-54]